MVNKALIFCMNRTQHDSLSHPDVASILSNFEHVDQRAYYTEHKFAEPLSGKDGKIIYWDRTAVAAQFARGLIYNADDVNWVSGATVSAETSSVSLEQDAITGLFTSTVSFGFSQPGAEIVATDAEILFKTIYSSQTH